MIIIIAIILSIISSLLLGVVLFLFFSHVYLTLEDEFEDDDWMEINQDITDEHIY